MDWIADTIDSFGRSAGIAQLRLDERGCLSFAVEGGRLLTLMDLGPAGGDEVLVTLRSPMPFPHGGVARGVLSRADFRRSAGLAPQLALEGDDLVATLRIARHSFLPSTLEEAVAALFSFHQRAAHPEAAT